MNQEQLDESHHAKEVLERRRNLLSATDCTLSFRRALHKLIPALSWLPDYKWKSTFGADLMAGFIVGILQIPQGMAYGDLAGVDPVHGLYTSLFPSLIYFWLGTSRHISVGAFSVACLMISDTRYRILPNDNHNSSWSTNRSINQDFDAVDVTSSLCMLVGIMQLLMAVLHFGFLAHYLSDQVISGFTTGAAVHAFASQLEKVFAIKVTRYRGFGKLYFFFMELIIKLAYVNKATLIISTITIISLIISKDYLNTSFKRYFHIPIPIDLIVVIVSTSLSYAFSFAHQFNVETIRYIPLGLPYPRLPRFDLMQLMLVDAFSISLVIFSVSVSMGRIFARKHHYKISANQEMTAFGLTQLISSLFECFPSSGSLGRSVVFEGAGAKSQVAALISCGLILTVLFWLGPFFGPLPKCILSCIVIVALKGFFAHFKDLLNYWSTSKIDAAMWFVAFVATLCFDVIIGLVISISFSLVTLLMRYQWPEYGILGRVPNTDIFVRSNRYLDVEYSKRVKIFRFSSSLHFANVRLFKSCFWKAYNCEIAKVDCRKRPFSTSICKGSSVMPTTAILHNASNLTSFDLTESGSLNPASILPSSGVHQESSLSDAEDAFSVEDALRYVILDCSGINFIDSMGIQALIQVKSDLEQLDVQLYLASCNESLLTSFDRHFFYENISKAHIFPTLSSAVSAASFT